MEAGEENSPNNLKRQRAPLSDSEDNIHTPPGKDGQKRRRLEAAGRENYSPKRFTFRHEPEAGPKPDTPIVPSVRSRVLQLTQRRGGASPLAQRCLSDPGADSPSDSFHDRGIREQLLGEEEFSQRMEKFKLPVGATDPGPSQMNPCPRTRSNFVHNIHQKLQGSPTSSEQASRIRQEREKEFRRLNFQPISENPWLKRSTSDPSLNQGDGDADMKDGSFTEGSTSMHARNLSVHSTGEGAPDSADPASGSCEWQLQQEWKKQNVSQDEEIEKQECFEASAENEQCHAESHQLQSQTVLKLSFHEGQSLVKTFSSQSQNVMDDEQSVVDSVHPEELDIKEACELSRVTEQSESDMFSPEDDEMIESSLNGEEDFEPSTDEESRLWRYPKLNVEDLVIPDVQEGCCATDEERALSSVENQRGDDDDDDRDASGTQGGQCCLSKVSAETAGSFTSQKDEGLKREMDSGKAHCPINRDKENIDAHKRCREAATENTCVFTTTQGEKRSEECVNLDDVCQHSEENLESVSTAQNSRAKETASASLDGTTVLKVTKTGNSDGPSSKDVAQLETCADPKHREIHDATPSMTEAQASEHILDTDEMEQEAVDERQSVTDDVKGKTLKAEGTEGSKKVTFILEPEHINVRNSSVESKGETSTSDVDISSHDDTNTAEIIDQMFDEVLECAGRMEEDGGNEDDAGDHDSGIVAGSGNKDKTNVEAEKEKSEEEANEECDELTFPSSGILSPLSKSVEAVVTPMRLAVSQESNPPSLLLTPEETTTTPTESAPLYSIDAYRTQRQSKLPSIQSVTPGVQRRAPEKSRPQQSVDTKERIAALNEEAGKLQSVINQTLQALSCCTDQDHGQGSLEEAEAEKLLLVSCEKRSALLAEVARLREERNSGEAAGEDKEFDSQQPCRGTVSITNIQLPLKVEFVCSSHSRTGRPSHYFFVLIRYGPCNIVATPLATAADAQNGDTISFPTSVTLKDIRSSFEIDVEVYSLSHTSGNNSSIDRASTKSRVTPRKLLNTITRSSNTLATAALPNLSTRRSSNFSLVGCHKITLASLGHSKFPLDKMKLEGKIRRLLGDEFQEKVPFLSPLEGNIYLQLHSESHSNVQHQGFLTMFELISGYGVWNRRYFVLDGCNMSYWNHPNDRETKEAEGNISLTSCPSHCVRPVKRDSCARPFTFELVSSIPHQQDESEEALAKCWFSADTKEERLDWMEKLNQALLDFHTWTRASATETKSVQWNASSSGNLRESIL